VLKKALGFVSRGGGAPTYGRAVLEAGDDTLTLTYVGDAFAVRVVAPASTEGQGKVEIDPKPILELLKSAPEWDELTIEVDGVLTVTCKGAEHSFPAALATDYPPFPAKRGTYTTIAVDRRVLQKLLEVTRHTAASEKDWHLPMTVRGVLFEVGEGGTLRCVATDTVQLSIAEVEGVEVAGDAPASAIITTSAVKELAVALGAVDYNIATIKLGKAQSFADLSCLDGLGVCYALKGVAEGEFPNYRAVLEKTKEQPLLVRATYRCADLLRGLGSMSPHGKHAKEKVYGATVQFGDPTTFSYSSEAGSSGKVKVKPLEFEGEPATRILNVPLLTDYLKRVRGSTITIEVRGTHNAITPVILTCDIPADTQTCNLTYVIMPMMETW
jgi:DNA polymerase III sliding clamp (beta) subunit (PCNA family)